VRSISGAVGRRFDLDPILKAAVSEIARTLQVSRCFFYQLDDMGFLRLTHDWAAPGVLTRLEVAGDVVTPDAYQARQTGRTVRSDDVAKDSLFGEAMDRQLFNELAVAAAVATPVVFQGTILGLIGVHQCGAPRNWTADDVELLELAASHLSILMMGCRVFADQGTQADALARMNEDLSKLYVELAAKDAQIDRFIHLISHDLRAPVVAIQGLVDLLRKGYENEAPDSKPRRYLELITHSADQITNLTGALLEYARLGQSSLALSEVDTGALLREVWQRLALKAEDAELAVFESLPVVRADRAKLSQIFQNLLENAIKYRSPEGRLIVDVTCQESDSQWQFAVNDNGLGFHPSQAESLFDLFARLKEVRNKPGSGIGLASVMEIARLHGGTAWAIGRPGKGATFYFTVSKKIAERPVLQVAPT